MSNKLKLLSVGDGIQVQPAGWSFAGETVSNFDKQIRHSIPSYNQGHELICKLSEFFVRDNSICYELGTSLGTLVAALAKHNRSKNVQWIAIDQEPDMIAQAKKNYQDIDFQVSSLEKLEFKKCDLIVSYYTLQFTKPKKREKICKKIYKALNKGGAFIVFEKVRANSAKTQDYFNQTYYDFKLDQGYTAEEVLNKSISLKSILEPLSAKENIEMFKNSGFSEVSSIMKWLCFEGWICIK